MSKRIAIMGLLMSLLIGVKAQEKLNIADVDMKTYQLFLEGKWTELIQLADDAREQGIDFFYLQVRTGIAWYSQGKYRKASDYFLQAYQSDQSLEWLQEYVYYSLIYSGRSLEAVAYAPHFSEAFKSKIGFHKSGVTHVAFETGYIFNPDFDILKARDFASEVNLGDDYGENYILKNYSYQSVDFSHRIAPWLLLNHNLTYTGVNREAVVDWGETTSSSIRINQFNYFINPVFVVAKKLNVSASMNLIYGNGDQYVGQLDENSSKSFASSKISYTDVVYSTSLWSDFGNFTPGAEANYAKINDSEFTQLSTWLTWYPLSNTNLYFTPKVYFKSTTGSDGFGWNAMEISGGATIWKFFVSGQYLFGNMANFVESGGYVISNFAGKSDRKIMGSIYFPLTKKYQFVLRYINQRMIENYQVYTNGTKGNTMEYNYQKHSLTAGISWNF
jgi:tetratricopeptide (TPR) repeat protein